MALPNSLRTIDLSHAGGISVELVAQADQAVESRVLGRQGVLPAPSLLKEPTRERVPAFLG